MQRVASLICQGLFILAPIFLPLLASAKPATDDLNPVTFHPAPKQPPVLLVDNGQPKGTICVMVKQPNATLQLAITELQECIAQSTGAKLPIVNGEIKTPGIVIGDCPQAAQVGLIGSDMPVEGFAIKTAPELVFIVGHDQPVDTTAPSTGAAWGIFEFLERFVGVRWYWPTERGGRSLLPQPSLSIKPVSLTDAPYFRKRDNWPPIGNGPDGAFQNLTRLHTTLRCADSWPAQLVVHSPRWWNVPDYRDNIPEVFQMRADGTRNYNMLCYGNPKTLEIYLAEIARVFDDHQKPDDNRMGIRGNAITVSPYDMAVACYCPDCRKLFDEHGGQYGSASKVIATFVSKLASEVKKRWPDKTIIYLPYMNYTAAPDGVTFSGNVEVQICGMPGIAQYKEPSILAWDQANIDKWARLTGRKVQNWHYSCWPEDRTKAPYQYPHVLQAFYQHNRNKVIGSFINGEGDHWPRQHISLYCWLKLLWNPDFNVDKAIDAYCRRMYGPATAPMRTLVQLQIDGWEKSRWPNAAISPKAIYAVSYPPKTVEQMQQLLQQARTLAANDPTVLTRLDYFEIAFKPFFKEFDFVAHGKGTRPLMAQKVAENPVIDGKLDDAVWQKATAGALVKHDEKTGEKPVLFATEVKAVWTLDGITFGLRMSEPNPDGLVKDIKARDDSLMYWQDCVETFLDVTGKGTGDCYQWLINAGNAVADFKNGDGTWNLLEAKSAVYIGADYWSLELYLPFAAFPEAKRPGTGTEWLCQFTRNRLSKDKAVAGQENQKLNAQFGGFNSNLADFAPLRFVE